MGSSRKYPYTYDGRHRFLTPPLLRKFQNLFPPLSQGIPKSSCTPPEIHIIWIFSEFSSRKRNMHCFHVARALKWSFFMIRSLHLFIVCFKNVSNKSHCSCNNSSFILHLHSSFSDQFTNNSRAKNEEKRELAFDAIFDEFYQAFHVHKRHW